MSQIMQASPAAAAEKRVSISLNPPVEKRLSITLSPVAAGVVAAQPQVAAVSQVQVPTVRRVSIVSPVAAGVATVQPQGGVAQVAFGDVPTAKRVSIVTTQGRLPHQAVTAFTAGGPSTVPLGETSPVLTARRSLVQTGGAGVGWTQPVVKMAHVATGVPPGGPTQVILGGEAAAVRQPVGMPSPRKAVASPRPQRRSILMTGPASSAWTSPPVKMSSTATGVPPGGKSTIVFGEASPTTRVVTSSAYPAASPRLAAGRPSPRGPAAPAMMVSSARVPPGGHSTFTLG
eukprot:TRINITY_DN46882_c0_g1_i1.p1 TRINITY_DN46882_c0_g1~~TRINITY_DN46882_c0_g1_i1.p1  ORF type:complete len:288 (-),score=32.39 TRINITY_DN46882_c0_g1_i1:104-967(-)